jgi:hypothetical protein
MGASCPTRPQIEANFWLTDVLPPELCAKEPLLQEYGFYRKLNNGKWEFISYCNPLISNWTSIYKDDLRRILNAFFRNKSPNGLSDTTTGDY